MLRHHVICMVACPIALAQAGGAATAAPRRNMHLRLSRSIVCLPKCLIAGILTDHHLAELALVTTSNVDQAANRPVKSQKLSLRRRPGFALTSAPGLR